MNAESAFTGPNLLVMAVFALLAVMSGVLISGRGSWMISGCNLASPAERSKYNEKRLCRTTGVGLAVIAVAVLALGLLGEQLTDVGFGVVAGVILVDTAVMLILYNTWCKKR